jgi:AbiV family abortive infection protein
MPPDKIVRVPLSEAREGCRLLIEKIRDHLASAATLMLQEDRLQGASLFVLLAFEESGKLLQLIQVAATAECQHASIVELKDLTDHEGKASLTTDYVVRVLNHITSALRSAGFSGISDESFGGYLDHLTAVGNGFMKMRASLMFVDYRNGMWLSGRSVSKEFLGMDLGSLGFFVSAVETALEKHATFRDLGSEFDSLDKELRDGLPKVFQEFARIASEARQGDELGQQLRESKAEKDFGTGG